LTKSSRERHAKGDIVYEQRRPVVALFRLWVSVLIVDTVFEVKSGFRLTVWMSDAHCVFRSVRSMKTPMSMNAVWSPKSSAEPPSATTGHSGW